MLIPMIAWFENLCLTAFGTAFLLSVVGLIVLVEGCVASMLRNCLGVSCKDADRSLTDKCVFFPLESIALPCSLTG